MIERFKKDNDGKMDDERAALEVDKFMMDSEMVNALVNYEQRKSRGEIMPDGPQFDWFTLAISGYLVYVFGSLILKIINGRNAVVTDEAGVNDAIQGAVDAVAMIQHSNLDSTAVQISLDTLQSSM
jgi:hypothetical protein